MQENTQKGNAPKQQADQAMGQEQADQATGQPKAPGKKGKGRAGLILLVIVLILAAAGGTAYYFMEKKKPEETVKRFLADVQKMDFDAMQTLLQSSDLSALDSADVRNSPCTEFFQNVNKKMTYEITANDFDIQSGTAQVTAHIKYIDGTDIFKEMFTELYRQSQQAAFFGDSSDDEAPQADMASILMEKADKAEEKFLETDIVYPVIKTGDVWKIVSLNADTVTVMSANFQQAKDEINQTLDSMTSSDGEDTEGTAQNTDATLQDSLRLENDTFSLAYTKHTISKDFAGKSCLMLYYDYTNNGSTPSSALVDVHLQVYQHGQALEPTIPEKTDAAVDNFYAEVQPGSTVNICQVFTLTDTSDATAQVSEFINFADGKTVSQILKIQ